MEEWHDFSMSNMSWKILLLSVAVFLFCSLKLLKLLDRLMLSVPGVEASLVLLFLQNSLVLKLN